jgi:hypothetical protein
LASEFAKLLEMNSFFTWHIFLEVGKTQDLPNKIWQTLRDDLTSHKKKNTVVSVVTRLRSTEY